MPRGKWCNQRAIVVGILSGGFGTLGVLVFLGTGNDAFTTNAACAQQQSADRSVTKPGAPSSAQKLVDDAAGAPGRFQLPDGFTIEAVAQPPLVRYPLFGCFDDAGQLYVAEGTGRSVEGSELVKLKLGRITRLEDTDGDGKFDKSTVFADGFVFPQGVLWHDGVVYVASHPAIWRLEDTDGDGRADRRDKLVGDFNFGGNGCDIHGPFLGPDGRLYWTDGRWGYRIEGPDGGVLKGLASRVWRCRTDGRELERIAGGGFDNPVEVAWTPDGELLGTMDQGAGDCLLHYVEGGVYPEDHPCVREFTRTGPLLGVVKRYSVELPAALCGTMRYRSDVFGPAFRNALMTTHYMTHKLVRSTLVREGSTFRAEDADFLVSSDTHLRLTDVLEDADGSLLTIDMGSWFTYGFLGNVLPRPDLVGGIYRIHRVDGTRRTDPRGTSLHFAELPISQVVKLLDDPRWAVRDKAIAALAKQGDRAVRDLERVLESENGSVEARSNALWALCRIDTPAARAATRSELVRGPRGRQEAAGGAKSDASASPDVQWTVLMIAVHAAGLHRDAPATSALIKLLNSDYLPLERKAAEALGRIGGSKAVPVLLDTLRRPFDRFLEHAVIHALIQINDRAAVLPGLESDDPRVQQASLIALDQMSDGNLTRDQVEPLLDSDDAALRRAALEVVSRRPEWAGSALGVLKKWLTSPELGPDERKSLTELLSAAGDADIARTAADALATPTTPNSIRVFLVSVLQQSRPDPLPAKWIDALRQALGDGDATLRWEALAVIRARGWRQFDDIIRKLSADAGLSPELRVAALECLVGAREPLDSVAFRLLVDHLSDSTPPLLRMAAARTLAASALSSDQLIGVAESSKEFSTIILRQLLPLFSRADHADVGHALVGALLESRAAESLTTRELDGVLKNYPEPVRDRAAPLREKLLVLQQDQAAYLARLTRELDQSKGDADAGKEVFFAPRNNCFACHRAVGRGGTIGPDLSKIGQFRTRSELLQSIVFPSFAIAPQYQTHSVSMCNGRVTTGLIVRETANAIELRTTDLAQARILRSDVDEIVPSTVSLMPDGLEKTLTPQQLANLLEFLCQQR